MKKLFITIFLLMSVLTYAQNPAYHRAGVILETQGGGDPANLQIAGKSAVYWNGTVFRKWDGTSWSDLVSAGYDEWATYTGTRIGANLLLTLGDYDSSGNGTKITIHDADEEVEITANVGFYVNSSINTLGSINIGGTKYSPNAQLTGGVGVLSINSDLEISVQGNNATTGIFASNNVTGNRTLEFPDASGTIALTNDITDDQTIFEIDASGYTPTYYTAIGGVLLDDHILGIDTELGAQTNNISTNTSDITDLQSGKIGGSIADNQVAVGSVVANEIEGNTGFTFSGNNLGVGVDDTSAGSLALRGSNINNGGTISLYNGAATDTNVELWEIQADANGDFSIEGFTTKALVIDDLTLGITAPATSIADITTLGNPALITKEYGDANYLGGGISNIVEDLTPQLGGDLDWNGNNISSPSDNLTVTLDNDQSATATSLSWKSGTSGKKHAEFTFGPTVDEWSIFRVGANDDISGSLELYGDNQFNGGLISIYNPAFFDTTIDKYDINVASGNFVILDGVGGKIIEVDDATRGVTAPLTSIADITSLGNTALITKEYGDANYLGGGTQSLQDIHDASTGTGNYAGGLYAQSPNGLNYFDMGFLDDGSYWYYDGGLNSNISIIGRDNVNITSRNTANTNIASIDTDNTAQININASYSTSTANQLLFSEGFLKLERTKSGAISNRLYIETPTTATAINQVRIPAVNVTSLSNFYVPLKVNGQLADNQGDIVTAINNQTGTTYTLILADQGDIVTMNNASANNLTIPANATVAYPIGTEITVINKGAGVTTIGITTDTLNQNVGGLTMAQYDKRTLTKITATSWILGY